MTEGECDSSASCYWRCHWRTVEAAIVVLLFSVWLIFFFQFW